MIGDISSSSHNGRLNNPLKSALGPKSRLVGGGTVGADRQRIGEALLLSQGWPKYSRESSPPT